jgi:hypothetical protein
MFFFDCKKDKKDKMTERVFIVKVQELRDSNVQTTLSPSVSRVGGPAGQIDLSRAELYELVTKKGQQGKKKVGLFIRRRDLTFQSGVRDPVKSGTIESVLELDSGEVITFEDVKNQPDILDLSHDQLKNLNPFLGVVLGTSIHNDGLGSVRSYGKQFNVRSEYDAKKDRLVLFVSQKK